MIDNTTRTQEILGQAGHATVEALGLWAETNQVVLGALLDLSTGAAKEGLTLLGDIQRRTLEALRDGQASALAWQGASKQAPADPAGWYQKAMADGVSHAQKAFRLVEEHTQAVARAAGRIQSSAEQTSRGLQQTLADTVARTREIYARG